MRQDKKITQLTIDPRNNRLYLTMHFVTAEFDFPCAVQFLHQWAQAVNRIAPTTDRTKPQSNTVVDVMTPLPLPVNPMEEDE